MSDYRCMETIAPKSDWLVRIGHRFINLNYLRNEDVWNRKVVKKPPVKEPSNDFSDQTMFSTLETIENRIYSIAEESPLKNFDYLQQECLKNVVLLQRLATHLSGKTIDIICSEIFTKQKTNEEFVELFYKYFFSTFLHRRYTWFSLHLLIKASKAYPEYFNTTIKMLITDVKITSTVLQDFFGHISDEECSKYMKLITEIQFTPEQFDHILPAMYIMYKKSEKPDSIFHYIYTNLKTFGDYCAYNTNYGRLMFYFTANITGREISIRLLEKVIEKHCTAYKSPALDRLDQYVEDMMAPQMDFREQPQFIIPRPTSDVQMGL